MRDLSVVGDAGGVNCVCLFVCQVTVSFFSPGFPLRKDV